MKRQLVLASSNAGKIKEIQKILGAEHFELQPQSQYKVPDADETGLSFIENAIIKARHASRLTGLPAIADDSGLSVALLDGQPGIYSARYAGLPSNDEANTNKLLTTLREKNATQPLAFFYCAMVFIAHADDPSPLIGLGQWNGVITFQPQGDNGFGYDPVFYIPEEGCTSAQLPPEKKNRISHRGQALAKLLPQIKSHFQSAQ